MLVDTFVGQFPGTLLKLFFPFERGGGVVAAVNVVVMEDGLLVGGGRGGSRLLGGGAGGREGTRWCLAAPGGCPGTVPSRGGGIPPKSNLRGRGFRGKRRVVAVVDVIDYSSRGRLGHLGSSGGGGGGFDGRGCHGLLVLLGGWNGQGDGRSSNSLGDGDGGPVSHVDALFESIDGTGCQSSEEESGAHSNGSKQRTSPGSVCGRERQEVNTQIDCVDKKESIRLESKGVAGLDHFLLQRMKEE